MSDQKQNNPEFDVLAGMLVSRSVISQTTFLTNAHFRDEKNALIFRAIKYLYSHHELIDATMVGQILSEHGKLETVGGVEYLEQIALRGAEAVKVAAQRAGKVLHPLWQKREALAITDNFAREAADPDIPIATAATKTMDRLVKVMAAPMKDTTLSDIMRALFVEMELGTTNRISRGYSQLDLSYKYRRGDTVYIAARPRVGKTAWGCNLSLNFLRAGLRVLYVSLEMAPEMLVKRMVGMQSGIPINRLDNFPALDDASKAIVVSTTKNMTSMWDGQLEIVDAISWNIMMLRGWVEKMHDIRPVDVVIVDYLQLVKALGQPDRRLEVAEVSRAMRPLARSINGVLIGLCQFGRDVERGPKVRPPRLVDLKESGALEEDPDVVESLHRPSLYEENGSSVTLDDEPDTLEVSILKCRNGPATGPHTYDYLLSTQKITDTSDPMATRTYEQGELL